MTKTQYYTGKNKVQTSRGNLSRSYYKTPKGSLEKMSFDSLFKNK